MIITILESAIIKCFEVLSHSQYKRKRKHGATSSQIILGTVSNPYNLNEKEVAAVDIQTCLRHFWIVGSTGSGKSRLIEAMIRQLIVR